MLSPSAPSAGNYWTWRKDAPGYAEYKTPILVAYQQALSSCGIPKTDQKLFVQQLIQENGSLDPGLTGGTDKGYSFGIGQWNTYPVRSKAHLKMYPEQATLDWQLRSLAQSSCAAYHNYKGNIRLAIVAHNCPDCANAKAKPKGCSSTDSIRKFGTRWSCYFDDEVNSTRVSSSLVMGT